MGSGWPNPRPQRVPAASKINLRVTRLPSVAALGWGEGPQMVPEKFRVQACAPKPPREGQRVSQTCWQRAGKGSCVISLPETGHATSGEKALGSGRAAQGDGSNRSPLQTQGLDVTPRLQEGPSAAQKPKPTRERDQMHN